MNSACEICLVGTRSGRFDAAIEPPDRGFRWLGGPRGLRLLAELFGLGFGVGLLAGFAEEALLLGERRLSGVDPCLDLLVRDAGLSEQHVLHDVDAEELDPD